MSVFLASVALCAPLSVLPPRPVVEVVPAPAVPAEVLPLRSLLSAHHSADLPSREAILANGGFVALGWLAEHDVRVGIRVRALDLIAGLAPDRDLCLRASAWPGSVQAAAFRCLARLESVDADVAQRVREGARSEDPRARAAALHAADALLVPVP